MKKSPKSVAPRQEVKVLVQIGKEVMFYQWYCNYGGLICVCRTRFSHWGRTHQAQKEKDLCLRSTYDRHPCDRLTDAAQAAVTGALPALALCYHELEAAQLLPRPPQKKPKKPNPGQQPLKEAAALSVKLRKNKLLPPGQCLARLFSEQAYF